MFNATTEKLVIISRRLWARCDDGSFADGVCRQLVAAAEWLHFGECS